jgi:SAM-dependent methyltransferase
VTSADEPRLYQELAPWFHLLTSPVDYEEEAELYGRLLVEHAEGPVETVLELGSGGGNNASHLKRRFTLTLVDRSPEMLELSRGLNPELEHVEGDMRTVRLDRVFDAVFAHDALAYILTEPDLKAVFETAFSHCRPGGSAAFVPDYVQETFAPRTSHGGHDSAAGIAVCATSSGSVPIHRTRRATWWTSRTSSARARAFVLNTIVTSAGCFPRRRGCAASTRPASTSTSSNRRLTTSPPARLSSLASGDAESVNRG